MDESSNRNKPAEPNRSVTDQAAEWLAILSDEACDPSERREFIHWLTRSNTHVDEFLRMSTLTRRLKSTASWPAVDLEALVAEARTQSKVIDIGSVAATGQRLGLDARVGEGPGTARLGRRVVWRRTAAACLVLASVALLIQVPAWLDGRHRYTTGIGELRSVALEDGSVVQLNSLSQVRTRFTQGERLVLLSAGEAVFRVSKDPARPFRVSTHDADIVAVGTEFNVNARSNGTIVTVIEGRVAVSSPIPTDAGSGPDTGPALRSPVLSAGEQVIVQSRHAIGKATHVDPAKVTSWVARRLYFDDTSVSEAVRQFSNYSPQVIRINDPALGERRIVGTFDSSDPAALVQFLERYGDTTVTKTERGWILAHKKIPSEE